MNNTPETGKSLVDNFDYNSDLGIYTGPEFEQLEQHLSYNTEGHKNCFAVEDNSFWFNHRNEIILRCLSEYISKSEQFVDLGGGNGYVSQFLINNNFKNVTLIEPNLNGAVNAKKRGIENVICSMFSDKVIPSNCIENIGLFDVIEHIEDDDSFVKTIYNSLKSNGHLVITVPAFNFLWSYHDIQAGHFRRYNYTTLKNLLIKGDFEIVFSSYFFKILTYPNFILRTIPTFLGLKKNYNDESTKSSQHNIKNDTIQRLIYSSLEKEKKMILAKRRINFGNSMILIAKKR